MGLQRVRPRELLTVTGTSQGARLIHSHTLNQAPLDTKHGYTEVVSRELNPPNRHEHMMQSSHNG